ncbi:nuclease inhibitor protein [Fulvimarina endophytica]|uniref:Nuclease inhibitor protein n=1 Tax=Fulvimarina endophytica TaxID=2293836 RepID=A0A371X313_9HYPH|nr:host-nuclease inhibitor Gam family protein [Fulvimarina endophytica]RFC63625.1 nuclease inhibitor protein [Fulvimarina endophytica]
MAKKTRAKSKAIARVPQSRQEAVDMIGRVGELRRAIEAGKAAGDESLKSIAAETEERLEPLRAELAELEQGVQTWSEANRASLTNNGRVKSADLGTGKILWRLRPRKVTVRGVETVLESIKALGLARFVRTKEEINKDAMLADPVAASAIQGVSISSEGEDFAIEPAELAVADRQVA